jgi:hypothetical protein
MKAQQVDKTVDELKANINQQKESAYMVTSDGIYYFEGLVYLPKALQKQYILDKHDTPLNSHTRPEVVLTRLKETFYFPYMR